MDTLAQYARAHVLGYAALQALLQGTSQKSLEIVRLSVSNRVQKKLRKKYRAYIREYLARDGQNAGADREISRPGARRAQEPQSAEACRKDARPGAGAAAETGDIWMFWSTGIENAPDIVKKCVASVRENLPDRKIHILSMADYRDYVTFPSFIQERIDSGQMMNAHMADLLRLALLIKYGGTWIDATVLCTSGQIPSYMLDSNLFVFQDLKPGLDGHCQRISNCMITARPGNPILKLTRALSVVTCSTRCCAGSNRASSESLRR